MIARNILYRAFLIKIIIIAAVIAAFYAHWWWAGNLPDQTGAMAGAGKEMLRGIVTMAWMFTLLAALALPLKRTGKPFLTRNLTIVSFVIILALGWVELQVFITHIFINTFLLLFAYSRYDPPAPRSGQHLQ